jgi:hypothetical protein
MPMIATPSPFDRPPKPDYRQVVVKPACISPRIVGNCGNSANFVLNPDWRKCPAELVELALPPFSLQCPLAVRPQHPHPANAVRRRTILVGHGPSALSNMPFRDLPPFMLKDYGNIRSNFGSCPNKTYY